MNYLLWFPTSLIASNSDNKLPLLIFLHGAGESGNDIDKVKLQGPPRLVEQYPNGTLASSFILIAPQSPYGHFSSELGIFYYYTYLKVNIMMLMKIRESNGLRPDY